VRRLLSTLLLLLAGGCAFGPVAPTPVLPPPPVPVPVPVDPGPVTPTTGAIDEAGYAAILDGATEADVIARLGAPFRKSVASGFTIYVYAFRNSDSVAWLYFSAGVVVRKARL
jgi:hypothetical protein